MDAEFVVNSNLLPENRQKTWSPVIKRDLGVQVLDYCWRTTNKVLKFVMVTNQSKTLEL